MKKIALLVSSLNSGGAERVVSYLSKILSEKYIVHVILFDATEIDYDYAGILDDLKVAANNSANPILKIKLLLQRAKHLRTLEKKEQLDCVISFLDSPNFVNLLVKTAKCKRIISIRNYSSIENKSSLLGKSVNCAMKYLYRKANAVVAVSKMIEMNFSKYYKIPSTKISTIYNPYDFEKMIMDSKEQMSEKESTYFEKNFVYINVSRLMHQKGIWHLIKAFSIVKSKIPDTKLVLVGEDLSDGKVVKLIKELNLEASVLLTGRVKNPYKYMSKSNVYVLSSLFEGFPNSMVEAMACGCAVIATDCPSGPREILYNLPNFENNCKDITIADYGVLIPCFDQKEDWNSKNIIPNEILLANAMMKLYYNETVLTDLQAKAIIRSRSFSFEECKEAYCKIIEDVN